MILPYTIQLNKLFITSHSLPHNRRNKWKLKRSDPDDHNSIPIKLLNYRKSETETNEWQHKHHKTLLENVNIACCGSLCVPVRSSAPNLAIYFLLRCDQSGPTTTRNGPHTHASSFGVHQLRHIRISHTQNNSVNNRQWIIEPHL